MQRLSRARGEDYNYNTPRSRAIKQWIMKSTPCRYWSMGIECPYGNSCWYAHEEKDLPPRIDEHFTFAPISFLYGNGLPFEYSIVKDRGARRIKTNADKSDKWRNKHISIIGHRGSLTTDAKLPSLDANISGSEAMLENNTSTSSESDGEQKNENKKLRSMGNSNRIVCARERSLLEELRDITPYDVLQEKDPRSDLSMCCLYASSGECVLGESCYFMHPK
uniref:C3H1-type domain-containing protein n=1 Tax=Parascaris univalens TaxID=6257 RepID=A0A915BVH2_PARUN